MFKKNATKQGTRGFTLLEILFVIVIMAGFLVAWVMYTQRNTEQNMASKTAEQMLNLVTASRAYFTSQLYYWPKSFADLKTTGYIDDVAWCSSRQKVTHGDTNCANGSREVYQMYSSVSDTAKAQLSADDVTKAKLFGISLNLSSEAQARKIASQLPMYDIRNESGAWQVIALTTVPEVASDLKGKILKVGTVGNNQAHNNRNKPNPDWTKPSGNPTQDAQRGYVRKPNCPAPLEPAIFFVAYDFMLPQALGGGGAPIRSMDVWCETGVKDPHDPTQLSIGFDSYEPASDSPYCDGNAAPAYAGPQFCDYEPTLNAYPDYWRLNYWACRNAGPTTDDGKDASIIYFVTCLDPSIHNSDYRTSQFFYPFAPANDTVTPFGIGITDLTTRAGNSYYLNKKAICDLGFNDPEYYAGCPYPTGCAYKNATQNNEYCTDKRRRCRNPAPNPSDLSSQTNPYPILQCVR